MATQTLFTSQFAKATFDPSKNYIYFQYLEATADMEAEEYKALLMTYLEALTKLYEDKIIEEKSLIYLVKINYTLIFINT